MKKEIAKVESKTPIAPKGRECSFCERTSDEVTTYMTSSKNSSAICNFCIQDGVVSFLDHLDELKRESVMSEEVPSE